MFQELYLNSIVTSKKDFKQFIEKVNNSNLDLKGNESGVELYRLLREKYATDKNHW